MSALLGDYEVIQQLGVGTFGVASRVRRRSDGQDLVWKSVLYGKMDDRKRQLLKREVKLLQELKHPHIVRYEDCIDDREHKMVYILMEYCAGGDLDALIKDCRKSGFVPPTHHTRATRTQPAAGHPEDDVCCGRGATGGWSRRRRCGGFWRSWRMRWRTATGARRCSRARRAGRWCSQRRCCTAT